MLAYLIDSADFLFVNVKPFPQRTPVAIEILSVEILNEGAVDGHGFI